MPELTIEQAFALAAQLHQNGKLQKAAQLYRQILTQQPEHAEAMHGLGVIKLHLGPKIEAVDLIRRAIELKPDVPEAYSNLGLALRELGRFDEAIAAYRQAIALRPNWAEAHTSLGNALACNGQIDGAIAAQNIALSLNPKFARAHSNLGNILQGQGRFAEATAAYERAIAADPTFAEAHRNLATILLAQGDFQRGWDEYEWRWKCKDHAPPPNFVQPRWDGRPLEGRTLLLYAEQGFGDVLQLIRYLPQLTQLGRKIIFVCPVELHRILRTIAEGCQLLSPDQPLPPFDFHCALSSLPRVLGTTLASVPTTVPYLRADADAVRSWRQRLPDHDQFLNVGLAWAGNPAHTNDRNRSITLALFSPLKQISGVRFFSLQKGDAAAQARVSPAAIELVDWTDQINDFADTAALIENLDLIISVDTAVVHLAGAIGKPVWVMLPFVADWRWLLEHEDSPWYPTMRLFRQSHIGDWNNVIAAVTDALRQFPGSSPGTPI
jgi:Flp pilus assembly protein TadD